MSEANPRSGDDRIDDEDFDRALGEPGAGDDADGATEGAGPQLRDVEGLDADEALGPS
jgi:hypothetical protein